MKRCGLILLLSSTLAGRAIGKSGALEFPRRFEPRVQPAWAELFAKVQASPGNWELRKQLADGYAAAGYSAAARFFRYRPGRDRVPVGTEEPAVWPPHWGCPEKPESVLDIRRAADRIEELVRTGRYDLARSETESAESTLGPACQLLAERSRITLLDAIRKKAGPGESEAAVRTLITAVEELNVEPVGLVKPTGLYEFLSQYFCGVHDFVSCVSALDFAVARLEDIPPAEAKVLDAAGWRAALRKRRQSTFERLKPSP